MKSIENLKIQPLLIHFSTDQIYNSNYFKKSKESEINLCNFYGISKYSRTQSFEIKETSNYQNKFFWKSYNKKKVTYSDFNRKFKKKSKSSKMYF